MSERIFFYDGLFLKNELDLFTTKNTMSDIKYFIKYTKYSHFRIHSRRLLKIRCEIARNQKETLYNFELNHKGIICIILSFTCYNCLNIEGF